MRFKDVGPCSKEKKFEDYFEFGLKSRKIKSL